VFKQLLIATTGRVRAVNRPLIARTSTVAVNAMTATTSAPEATMTDVSTSAIQSVAGSSSTALPWPCRAAVYALVLH
jgi:hypothetical protein